MTTPKAKKVKARVMWAVMSAERYGKPQICTEHPDRPLIYENEARAVSRIQTTMHETVAPVFILPASPEAVEQMREQVGEAIQRWLNGYALPEKYPTVADAALASLGLPAAKQGK